MKILFILTQDLESPSGLGRYAPMARELSKLGHKVAVAALHSNYEELEAKSYTQDGVNIQYVAPMHVRKQGSVKTYYSPARLLWVAGKAALSLTRTALRTPADIVHIGKPHPMNSIAGMAARAFRGVKMLVDCDDYEAGVGHFHSRWERAGVVVFEDHIPSRADHVTTNTYYTRQRLIDLGVPPERIRYISNGVDRDRFKTLDPSKAAGLRQELGLAGRQVVVFVGSLSRPGHPVDLLFDAFRQVREQIPQSALVVVGGGDDYHRLQTLAAEMGVARDVVFTGRIPPEQAPLYYQAADVSIDPVLNDAAAWGRSPLKLFESWACGTPFVSCDAGDRKILLGDPPAGLLAQPGSAESLAEQILKVLREPDQAALLSKLGTERVQSYYWDVLVKDLDSLYQHVLRRPPGSTV